MASPNRLVTALVYDGLCNFEFSCAAEVFGLPRPEFGPDWYSFETVGIEGTPVRGNFGLCLVPDAPLERIREADTIVIPGWKGAAVPETLVAELKRAYERGARLLSVCSGSFVIAATGLLNGRRATTHWQYAELMRRMYPEINVDADVLYVDEGNIITSAGSAAGLDACLHLVRRDFGSGKANQLARRLVVPAHRDGGQAQFIERPVPRRERDPLSPVLQSMTRDLNKELPISHLARLGAMSERTFMRRFKQKTGMTPADWLSVVRVDRARELLEATGLPVEIIASECGLGTGSNLRHHFRRKLGISPTAYRKRFAAVAS